MSLLDEVLAALKRDTSQWLSGEELSTTLKVSRTAIWKQVKLLRNQGYQIESSPKKGYRLELTPDLLLPSEVLPGLATSILGVNGYYYYPELDSTSIKAREMAEEGRPEGTVVAAEIQTAGRGRRGRYWFSAPATSLYFSFILRPVLPLRNLPRISLTVALAVAELVEEKLHLPAQIKWPNDVYVNRRKIAGILSEAVTDLDTVHYMVIGIGLNLLQRADDFPDEIRKLATSALIESGSFTCTRAEVLQHLLLKLEQRYLQLISGGFADILDKIKSRSLVIGQEIRLDDVNGPLNGRAVGIDENGFLLLRDSSGSLHTITSGEITLLPS